MNSKESNIDLDLGWKLWPVFRLRSAGFPVRGMVELESKEIGKAIDKLLSLQQEALLAREYAAALVSTHLAEQEQPDPEVRAFARRLPRTGPINTEVKNPELKPAAKQINRLEAQVERQRQRLEDLWGSNRKALSAKLCRMAQDPLLREAISWQNNQAATTILNRLKPDRISTNKKFRRAELVLVRYLQRYTTKNETVGFYGPGGFGRYSSSRRPPITQKPGSQIIAGRSLHLETWAVAGAIKRLSRDPNIFMHLPLRLASALTLRGGRLFGVDSPRDSDNGIELEQNEMAVLDLVDDRRTFTEVVAALCSGDQFYNPADAEILVRNLLKWNWIDTNPRVPVCTTPEDAFSTFVLSIKDSATRRRVKRLVSSLLVQRDTLAQAGGHPDRVATELTKLDRLYEKRFGLPATRHAGWTYGARTLTWQSCLRNTELTIGQPVLSRLRKPLALLLESARWYGQQVAIKIEQQAIKLFSRLQQGVAGDPIHLDQLLLAMDPYLLQLEPPLITSVAAELRKKWGEIFQLHQSHTGRHLKFSSAQLRSKVQGAFAATGPGWPGGRYVAPDIMIAAPSQSALKRGQFQLVLGEIHPGINPFQVPLVVALAEQVPGLSDQLKQSFRDEIEEPTVNIVPQTHYTLCANDGFFQQGFHLDTGSTYGSWRPPEQVLQPRDFSVTKIGEHLYAQHKTGLKLPLLTVLERPIKIRAATHFGLKPKLSHCPRVSIDDLVVIRESWTFGGDELTFLSGADEMERLIQTRRFFARGQLPSRVFVHSPVEVKPIYVSIDAPHLVENLCKLAAKSEHITLVEMLPDLDQAWLRNTKGDTYVSEIRSICLDPHTFSETL